MGKLNIFSLFTRRLIGRDVKNGSNQIVPSTSILKEDQAPTAIRKFQSHQDLFRPIEEIHLDNDTSEDSATSISNPFNKATKSLSGKDCGSRKDWLNSVPVKNNAESNEKINSVFERIGSDRDSSSVHSEPAGEFHCDNSSHNMSFKDLAGMDGFVNSENGQFFDRHEATSLSFPRILSANMHASTGSENGVDIECHRSDPGAYGHHSLKSQSAVSWNSNSAENNIFNHEFIAENPLLENTIAAMDDISDHSAKAEVTNEEATPFSFLCEPMPQEEVSTFLFIGNGERVTKTSNEVDNESVDHFSDDSAYSLNKISHIIHANEEAIPVMEDNHLSEGKGELQEKDAAAATAEENADASNPAVEINHVPLRTFHVWGKFMRKDTHSRVEQWIMDSSLNSPLLPEENENETGTEEFNFLYGSAMESKRSLSASHLLSLQDSNKAVSAGTFTGALMNADIEAANRVARLIERNAVIANISSRGLKLIPGLTSFQFLKSVSLSHNSIVRINAGALPRCLHVLNLSHNRLSSIEGLRELNRLRILNISHNRISRIGHGLSGCTALKELYLTGNKISEVEGLHRLLKLCILDLSANKITSTKALSLLAANYGSMQALNLISNPIHVNLGADAFKRLISSLLPHLLYLNKQPIKAVSARDFATDSVARAATGSVHRSSKTSKTKTSVTHRTLPTKPRSSSVHAKTRRGKEEKDDKRHGSKNGKAEVKLTRHRHHHHQHQHQHQSHGHKLDQDDDGGEDH